MKIKILGSGTSQGIPVIGCDCEVCLSSDSRDKRLRVSILLSIRENHIIIDIGPDFRQQLLSTQVKDLLGILITHEHNDHIIGLDDARSFVFRSGNAMPVFAEKRVAIDLRERFAYAFKENPYPGSPRFDLNVIDDDSTFSIGPFPIQVIRIWHGKLPILGFRVGSFAYLTDIKTIEIQEIEKLIGVDTLIISALQKKAHHSHATLEEALFFIKQIGPRRAYLTHVSHRMGLHEDVEKELPPNVYLAYDNLELNVD